MRSIILLITTLLLTPPASAGSHFGTFTGHHPVFRGPIRRPSLFRDVHQFNRVYYTPRYSLRTFSYQSAGVYDQSGFSSYTPRATFLDSMPYAESSCPTADFAASGYRTSEELLPSAGYLSTAETTYRGLRGYYFRDTGGRLFFTSRGHFVGVGHNRSHVGRLPHGISHGHIPRSGVIVRGSGRYR